VIEHLGEHRQRLPDRLALQRRELDDEVGDGGDVELVERTVAEAGEDPRERDPVGLGGPGRDVDP
jgi:hypothetical protein